MPTPPEHIAEKGRRCNVVGVERPRVWWDGDQWQTDQTTTCLTCKSVDLSRLADDDATWPEAVAAAGRALPLPSVSPIIEETP